MTETTSAVETPKKESKRFDSLDVEVDDDLMRLESELLLEEGKSYDEKGNVLNTTADNDSSDATHPPLEITADDPDTPTTNGNSHLRLVLGTLLLAVLVFVVVDTATTGHIKSGTKDLLEWVEDNPGAGVVVFTFVTFMTTLFFIPGIVLTLGSGYVFSEGFGLGLGVVLGTISAFAGSFAGATVSFLLGRFLMKDCVKGLIRKFSWLQALDQAMEEKGLRILLLLRLSPAIYASPYVNYSVGATSCTFSAYVLSLLAIFPSTVMYVFLGASAGSLSDSSSGGNSTTIVLVVGMVLSCAAIGLTTYYVRQELQKLTIDRSESPPAVGDIERETNVPVVEDPECTR
eukprot:Nitzschia sp. Nitz4//scaffold240_size29840//10832//11866//NITZ4_008017-RA/size29840-processed-gene-0.41-mRNA-1//-1//CDS//3329543747//6412//frame0